jgi:hypothetical protein
MEQARRGRAVAWAALAIVVAAGAAGAAAKSEAPPEAVSVTLLGIRATNEAKPYIDPALKAIEAELKGFKFNSFRIVANDTRSVPVGKAWELPMIEGYARRVEPEKTDGHKVTLGLSWIQYTTTPEGKREGRVCERLSLTIRKGKYLLSGGWKLKEGALLGAVAVK